jgi:tRNA threonylcarbamoyladenosine biosynthesis protein TsaE
MPILDANSFEFFSHSPEQTRRLGLRLGTMLKTSDLVCLSGDLGTGKTTLVQGIAQGWGSMDAVTSPTFVIVNEYRRPDGLVLSHMDAYRLESASEAEDLDPLLMLDKGALVIEWAERVRNALPEEFAWIELKWVSDEQRDLVFTPKGEHYQNLLENFRKTVLGS